MEHDSITLDDLNKYTSSEYVIDIDCGVQCCKISILKGNITIATSIKNIKIKDIINFINLHKIENFELCGDIEGIVKCIRGFNNF